MLFVAYSKTSNGLILSASAVDGKAGGKSDVPVPSDISLADLSRRPYQTLEPFQRQKN